MPERTLQSDTSTIKQRLLCLRPSQSNHCTTILKECFQKRPGVRNHHWHTLHCRSLTHRLRSHLQGQDVLAAGVAALPVCPVPAGLARLQRAPQLRLQRGPRYTKKPPQVVDLRQNTKLASIILHDACMRSVFCKCAAVAPPARAMSFKQPPQTVSLLEKE